jgi:hypothetical protein
VPNGRGGRQVHTFRRERLLFLLARVPHDLDLNRRQSSDRIGGRMTRSHRRLTGAALALGLLTSAHLQTETETYTYDDLGRLHKYKTLSSI